MSYILDALRRAEAERQRGAVPGLHAQPVASALADGGSGAPDSAHRPWRPGAVAAAGLLLAGLLLAAVGLGWLLKPASEAVPVAARPVVLPVAVPVAVPPALPQAVVPAGGAAAGPLAAPAALTPTLPPPGPAGGSAVGPAPALLPGRPVPTAVPVATPAADPAAAPVVASARSQGAVAAATVPAAGPVAGPAAQPTAAASPAAAPTRLPTLAELPEALRREVQPLNLGGSVYADQAPLRIVIVNGQVFHEGDKPLPELQVQQIRLKSVVFSVRGQRFEVPL